VELGRADSVTSASLARALAQPPRCSPRPGPPTGHTYTVVDVLGSKMDFSGSGTQASTSAMRATAGELSSALVCSRKNAAACANPSSGGPRRPLRAHCHQVRPRKSNDKYCLRLQERPHASTPGSEERRPNSSSKCARCRKNGWRCGPECPDRPTEPAAATAEPNVAPALTPPAFPRFSGATECSGISMSSPIDAPGLGSAGRSSQRRATTHGRDDETVVEWSMRESRASGRRRAALVRTRGWLTSRPILTS
jgi:hypothetical protein